MNNIFGSILGLFNALTQNPIQALFERGFNVPQDMANNPEQMIQHLLNSGQVSQEQVNQAMQMKDNPMFRNLFR